MRSLYHIYVWMIIIVCMTGTNAFAENKSLPANQSLSENQSLPDSLITDDSVYEYTFSDFDKAQRIMKELRKRKSLPDYRLDVTEGDLYYNRGFFNKALKFYKRALDNDSVRLNDERFMDQIHRMISLYDYLNNDVAKAQYVDMLLKKAEQCGNAPMKAVALFNMGRMLYFQGNKNRGYELMKEGAAQMEQTDYRLKYDNLRYHYNTLFMFQLKDQQYEEALASLEALKKVVTSETGAETQIEGLADKEKKTMYAQYATVLLQLGRTAEADEYYRRFLALAKENDYDNYLIMTYLLDREMYDEVISLNTDREKKLAAEGDTVTYHMTTVKKFLGRAYEEKGNYRAAARYYKELSVLRDSIKNREQRSTALELAALYETQEKDLIIQQQKSDVQIRTFWLVLAVCATVLLGIILCLGIRYNRKIRFKNNVLIGNIKELLQYKDKLCQKQDENLALQEEHQQLKEKLEHALQSQNDLEQQLASLSRPKQPEVRRVSPKLEAVDVTAVNIESEKKPSDEAKENADKALFERIDQLIRSERLFLDPGFSREKLEDYQIYINRNKLTPLMKQYAEASFPTYLNNLRLDYAARLLLEKPNYSVGAIAKECGIPASTTFYTLFVKKFKVTPANFRGRKECADN